VTLDFRVLGPLEVVRDGSPVALGGPKPRALVAVLLLQRGRAVSIDDLVDALWGAEPPASAAASVHTYVSRLRRGLGEVLVARPPGYALAVEPGRLDLDRFETRLAEGRELLRAGDAAAAAVALREALGQFRGEPLADLAFEPFAQAEVGRLAELRLGALEERLQADLDRGAHAEVVGELEALCAEHPLRERLRGQLMLALYRCGRQADALAAYAGLRRRLDEELGLQPDAALQRLERAILQHDPALAAPDRPVPLPAPAAEPVRKRVTVLVCDLAVDDDGDPERHGRNVDRVLQEARAALERHGAGVRFLPAERVVAVFGVPRVHEDDVLRAARAALELPAGARTGIASGDVVVAGDEARGPALSAAARLASRAEPTLPLVDGLSERVLRDVGRLEPRGDAFALLDLVPGAEAPVRRHGAPLVGRRREAELVRHAVERAADERRAHLLTVLGAPGVGKTRLAAEAIAELPPGWRVAQGRCAAYGEAAGLRPLADVAAEAAGAAAGEPPEQAFGRIEQAIAGERRSEALAARLAGLLGLREPGPPEETAWALRRLLEIAAARAPLLVVLDDLHWAEPAVLEAIGHVAEHAARPLVLLCLARPELLDDRPGFGGGLPNASSVRLEPLLPAEAARLAQELLGGEVDPQVEAGLLEAAGGNPLFTEELVAMLRDDGRLERADGRWVLAGASAALTAPPTIQALIAARLDGLGGDERRVLQRAAVAGQTFSLETLEALNGDTAHAAAERALLQLRRLGMVRPAGDDDSYAFRHALIRDAAYDALPLERRAALHERLARWLEANATEAERDALVGTQLERAAAALSAIGERADALRAEAAARLAAAGRARAAHDDVVAAEGFLARALALVGEADRERLALLVDLAEVQREVSSPEVLAGTLAALGEALERTPDVGTAVRARLVEAVIRLHRDPASAGDVRKTAADAIRTLTPLDDHTGLARAWILASMADSLQGKLGAERRSLERAGEHARLAGDARRQWDYRVRIGTAHMWGDTPAPALEHFGRELLAEARSQGDRTAEAAAEVCIGLGLALQGRGDEGREHALRGLDGIREIGLRMRGSAVLELLSQIELLRGDLPAAEAALREAYAILESTGEQGYLVGVAPALGSVLCSLGRHDEAEPLARLSREHAVPEDVIAQVLWRGVLARVLASRGQHGDAETLARQAVAMAARTECLNVHGGTLLALAEVLAAADRAREAAEAAESARAVFERKGNQVDAARATEAASRVREPGGGARSS
jgi:DNA-binding SARP family transcriptional activator